MRVHLYKNAGVGNKRCGLCAKHRGKGQKKKDIDEKETMGKKDKSKTKLIQ